MKCGLYHKFYTLSLNCNNLNHTIYDNFSVKEGRQLKCKSLDKNENCFMFESARIAASLSLAISVSMTMLALSPIYISMSQAETLSISNISINILIILAILIIILQVFSVISYSIYISSVQNINITLNSKSQRLEFQSFHLTISFAVYFEIVCIICSSIILALLSYMRLSSKFASEDDCTSLVKYDQVLSQEPFLRVS